ncbi:MAG: carboxypeptidase regulatory-like domain-containing protein [Pyrinomonadaceae bacterium]|nr:carboxypeptidase regulatory-like domain-containing protein [Pyrinomonadaceae bacterium]
MFKKNIIGFIFTVLCLSLSSSAIFAQQTDNGGLTGTVSDPNGAVVPNATIIITNTGTNAKRTLTTDEEGRWTISVLPLGNYEVSAEAAGFQPVKQATAVVASTTTPIDLVLGVTGGETVVDVTGAERDALVNTTDSSTVSSAVSGRALEGQPLVNRTPFGRLQLDTSSSGDIADPSSNSNGNPEISVNGTRTTSQGVQFNGVDVTNFSGTGSLTENISPAPETVQEVSFLSNLYDASLGRNGGGSIQVVTKSGMNAFTGSAYIYTQNEKFNANDFFFNRDGIDRQAARRLEGGFAVGGPIIKDKFWFFGGYQKTDALTAYVPTAQSFVILPEALLFITDRTNPENVRLAFVRSQRQGGAASSFGSGNQCIRVLTPTSSVGTIASTCIDPSSPGFRLLSTRNPATGDFFIPTLANGRFERLYYNTNNVRVLENGITRITDFTRFGLPNGLPIIDRVSQNRVSSGVPLVRFRNVFPAEFKQDQFTTRLDYNLLKGDNEGKNINTINGTFFFADFPATDPFPTDSLVSPTPLIRDDRNRTLAITDTHYFNPVLTNEARFGYFRLNNSRSLDERFLAPELTNNGLGIFNPAGFFEPGAPSQRAARFAGTENLSDFSLNAPTDIYNQRQQTTLTFADNVTFITGKQTFRFGVEYKRNAFDTNLPEEQGIEFEGLSNFAQLLTGFVPEADVAFGITDKKFRFNDLSFYVSDDWRLSERLTLNLGLRWDWFGLPTETNGRFANFDISRVTDPNDIRPGFILPGNSRQTGFNAIDASLPTIADAGNDHTLNGQDLNNFAPRVGFAFKPFKNGSTVIRGGYGIFYDRPSAAFINTIYSNYPFFREIEVKIENSPTTVQGTTAFRLQNPNLPFSNYFPFRIASRNIDTFSPYVVIDSSPGGSDSTAGAEPIEFRAIDRDLKTPLIQQWNLGIQQDFLKNWVIEARYVGTRGQQLLVAVGFNQPYDLNDPNTPDYIYDRINSVSINPLPPRTAGVSARQRGASTSANDPRAFGACNPAFLNTPGYAPCPGGGIDLNLNSADFVQSRSIISADVRVPYLGLDPTDAVMLQSRGYSFYHSGQLNLTRRFSKGFSFNASYTFSKSIDIGSTDPGSTAASGRPDTANLGLVVQGDQRNLNSNRALSDFDRPHRFSSSFVYELPNFGSKSKFLTGYQISGFGQWQSGTPFSIFASNASFGLLRTSGDILGQFFGEVNAGSERITPIGSGNFLETIFNVGVASGTIFNAAFGRPSVRNLDLLRRGGSDRTREYFKTCQDRSNPDCALLAPLGGFGNLGRNVLRGPSQKRIDLSFQKTTSLTERVSLELKWDIFNVLNFVNFANPNSDLSDETDFGQITRTVGAPRVMQFGAKVRF